MTKTIVVHSGAFHADDLFAVAVLKRFLVLQGMQPEEIEVIRTREKNEIADGDFVADVGGVYDPAINRFDHHQKGGAGTRENGVPYAAFGLVWKRYGVEVAGSETVARAIDERLVQTIDAMDNGVQVLGEPTIDIPYRYLLQTALMSLQPTWKEAETYTMNDAFFKALEIAEVILGREIVRGNDKLDSILRVEEEYINTSVADKRILLITKDYAYMSFVESNPQIIFVVKPDKDSSQWKVRAVPRSSQTFEARALLPSVWAGKRDRELAEVTGVPDAVFVHNKRFIGVAQSKEGALELAYKALEELDNSSEG